MNLINDILLLGCYSASSTEETTESSSSSWWMIVIYIVIFAAIIYFLMIRPQRKAKKEQESKMSSVEPGDSVLTTSGFYGTIVAINGDTVIVEFGNNKNCRIPMSKQAISQIEKANAGVSTQAAAPAQAGGNKKKFLGRSKEAAEDAQAQAEAAQAQAAKALENSQAEAAAALESSQAEAAKALEKSQAQAQEAFESGKAQTQTFADNPFAAENTENESGE